MDAVSVRLLASQLARLLVLSVIRNAREHLRTNFDVKAPSVSLLKVVTYPANYFVCDVLQPFSFKNRKRGIVS